MSIESDETLLGWAAQVFGPLGAYRLAPYGDGVGLMVDFADGTMRILFGADHPDAREWLGVVLRRDTLKQARQELERRAYTKPRLVPLSMPPAPFPQTPSYLPPAESDDERKRRTERELVSGAMEVLAETFWRSDPPPAPAPEPPSFSGGGGETGGGGATGGWDDSSSSSYDSGSSSDCNHPRPEGRSFQET